MIAVTVSEISTTSSTLQTGSMRCIPIYAQFNTLWKIPRSFRPIVLETPHFDRRGYFSFQEG